MRCPLPFLRSARHIQFNLLALLLFVCLAVSTSGSPLGTYSFSAIAQATHSPSKAKSNMQKVSSEEMNTALSEGQQLINASDDVMMQQGWALVHSSNDPKFSLYKRKVNTAGPAVYLMTGRLQDTSPRSFLAAQILVEQRKGWDTFMREMKCLSASALDGNKDSEDILYFRTGWPWPMNDRDYVLARRCQSMHKQGALVFISKSTDAVDYPKGPNIVRVDNYWCRTVIFSKPASSQSNQMLSSLQSETVPRAACIKPNKSWLPSLSETFSSAVECLRMKTSQSKAVPSNELRSTIMDKPSKEKISQPALNTPGLEFCTMFCDDSKVPLPAAVIDLVSKHAEKMVPASFGRMHKAARSLDNR